MVAVKTELEYEQAYVSILYQRLDTLRVRAAERVAQVLGRAEFGGTYQGRLERDALVTRYRDRLAQLWSAESGLCFGRLDLADGTRRYIGRLGLADDDRESLLVALNASRTGRMGDIVATIQAEQDRIIRSDLRGILVVEGGPGTGKTAVALHRAAYLLYTHRERLARRGVLVVGPNPTFLRYIEQVLPSLGETGVLLATTDELYPGVTATATEPPETAALKGSERMAGILAAAVADRQRLPGEDLEIRFDGQVLRLDRRTCLRARLRARAAGTPHNQARAMFRRELLAALSRQVVARLVADLPEVELPDDDLAGDDVPSERLLDAELEEIRAELAAAPQVREAIDGLWPRLTPEALLEGLLTSPDRLASAAPELSAAERARLLREPPDRRAAGGAGWWTPADVPLLDEAAVLLGEKDGGAAREALQAEQWRRELAYARGVLSMVGIDEHR